MPPKTAALLLFVVMSIACSEDARDLEINPDNQDALCTERSLHFEDTGSTYTYAYYSTDFPLSGVEREHIAILDVKDLDARMEVAADEVIFFPEPGKNVAIEVDSFQPLDRELGSPRVGSEDAIALQFKMDYRKFGDSEWIQFDAQPSTIFSFGKSFQAVLLTPIDRRIKVKYTVRNVDWETCELLSPETELLATETHNSVLGWQTDINYEYRIRTFPIGSVGNSSLSGSYGYRLRFHSRYPDSE